MRSYFFNLFYQLASPSHTFFKPLHLTSLGGDFNGDGKTDLLIYEDNVYVYGHSQSRILLSTGNGYKSHKLNDLFGLDSIRYFVDTWTDPYLDSYRYNFDFIIADVNNDGLSDILFFTTRLMITFLSTGEGFMFDNNWVIDFEGKSSDAVLMDINKNGKLEVWNKILGYRYIFPWEFGRELSKIQNGNGVTTEINYKPLSEIYVNGDNPNYPVVEMPYSSNKVENWKKRDKDNLLISDINYSYKGLKYHKTGLGILGFQEMSIKSILSNTSQKVVNQLLTISEISSDYCFLVPVKQQFFGGQTGTELISESSFAYDKFYFSNNRFRYWVNSTTSKDYINGFENIQRSFIDPSTGHAVRVETETRSITPYILVESSDTYNTYSQIPGFFQPSKVQTQTNSVTRAGQNAYTTQSSFDYDEKGNLKETKSFVGTPREINQKITYNQQGLPLIEAIQTAGVTRNKSYKYDPTNRFVIESTNALGQRTKYTYDPVYGSVKNTTSPNGLIATSELGFFGRINKTIDALGNTSEIILSWADNNSSKIKKTTITTNSPNQIVVYDGAMRELETIVQLPEGDLRSTKTYNLDGTPADGTMPAFSSDPPVQVQYQYDEYKRVNLVDNGERQVSTSFQASNGLFKTVQSTSDGQVSTTYADASGKVVKKVDNGGTIEYKYGSHGQPIEVKVNGSVVTTMEYDPITAKQLKLIDVNAGTTEYNYDNFGELIYQKDAKGVIKNLVFDQYGRLIQSTDPQKSMTYVYESSNNGLNQIKTIICSNGQKESYSYDVYGRTIAKTIELDNIPYTYQYAYDNFNNLTQMIYPSQLVVNFGYDNKNRLVNVSNANSTLFHSPIFDSKGNMTSFEYGNGIQTLQTFDEFGQLKSKTAGIIQDYQTNFDKESGNLLSRTNNLYNLREEFEYDNLDRLKKYEVSDLTTNTILSTQSLNYANNGNILSKSDVGSYTFDPTRKNAVVTIEGPYAPSSLSDQNITYGVDDRPTSITEGNYTLQFTYGIHGERIKTQLTGNTVPEIHYYLDGYEEIIDNFGITKVHYLPNGIVYVDQNGTGQFYYLHTDHLGSITEVSDQNGNLAYQQAFDPWGARRDPQTWTSTVTTSGPNWLRGYTGHEILDEFELINMNARLYDPALGRFLAVDNFVQEPGFSQSYNRYSYVWNNPMRYTDPDGEFVHLIVGAVIGGFTGALYGVKSGAKGWKLAGYIAIGAGVGALSAGVGAGVNAAIAGNAAAGGGFAAGFTGTATISSTGFIAGAVTGAAAGATNGLIGGTSYGLIEGQSFSSAFVQGGIDQAWKQGLSGAIVGGVFGGVDAAMNKRNFWTGDPIIVKSQPQPVVASTNNSNTNFETRGGSDYTLVNDSDGTIYFKPEGDVGISYRNNGAYPIESGSATYVPIDGVTHPNYPGQVYKVRDPFNNIVGASKNDIYLGGKTNPSLEIINSMSGAGWISSPYSLDKSWYALFKAAGYVFK